MQLGFKQCRCSHLTSFTVCADKVEPEILAHILNTESCGLKAWLSAAPADSHPEVLIALTEFAPVRTWFADMHGHVLGLLAAKVLNW